jgi:hypothetical protein
MTVRQIRVRQIARWVPLRPAAPSFAKDVSSLMTSFTKRLGTSFTLPHSLRSRGSVKDVPGQFVNHVVGLDTKDAKLGQPLPEHFAQRAKAGPVPPPACRWVNVIQNENPPLSRFLRQGGRTRRLTIPQNAPQTRPLPEPALPAFRHLQLLSANEVARRRQRL